MDTTRETTGGSPSATRSPGLGPLLAVVSGALVIVSRFLDAGTVKGPAVPFQVTVTGDNAILLAGVVLAVIGVLMWLAKSRTADLVLSIVAIVAGLFATLVSGVAIGSKDVLLSAAADAYAKALNASSARVETVLKRLAEAGQVQTSVKAGLWLALVGSILFVIAGIWNLLHTRRRAGSEPLAAMPPPPRPPAP